MPCNKAINDQPNYVVLGPSPLSIDILIQNRHVRVKALTRKCPINESHIFFKTADAKQVSHGD